MIRARAASLALCAVAACGRSQGVPDEELGGLVIEAKPLQPALDPSRAAKDRGEMRRALSRPHRAVVAAIGPHPVTIASATQLMEATAKVSDFSDRATIEV